MEFLEPLPESRPLQRTVERNDKLKYESCCIMGIVGAGNCQEFLRIGRLGLVAAFGGRWYNWGEEMLTYE